MMLYLLIEVTG